MFLVFEGDLDLGAIGLDLAVGDEHVLLHDLRDAQLAQMLRSTFHRVLGGFLPGPWAGADEFDDLVGTVGHGGSSFYAEDGHEALTALPGKRRSYPDCDTLSEPFTPASMRQLAVATNSIPDSFRSAMFTTSHKEPTCTSIWRTPRKPSKPHARRPSRSRLRCASPWSIPAPISRLSCAWTTPG